METSGQRKQIIHTQRLNPGSNDETAAAAFSSDWRSPCVCSTEADIYTEVLLILEKDEIWISRPHVKIRVTEKEGINTRTKRGLAFVSFKHESLSSSENKTREHARAAGPVMSRLRVLNSGAGNFWIKINHVWTRWRSLEERGRPKEKPEDLLSNNPPAF